MGKTISIKAIMELLQSDPFNLMNEQDVELVVSLV